MREPLSGLRGYLQGLEDGVFPADPVIHRRLQDELQRLQHLIEELESLAQAQSGATP
jgi:histidine kinase